MRAFHRAARARADAADELVEREPRAAWPLYREAAVLYMAAVLSVRSPTKLDEPLRTDQVVTLFGELEHVKAPPGSREKLRDFLAQLVAADPLLFDALRGPEAVDKLRELRPWIGWLGELVETRTPRELGRQRLVRLAVAGMFAIAIFCWVFFVKLAPPDIALHKPVSVSSTHPNSTAAPAGLTDGATTGPYGVHTNLEAAPWVQVDLLAVYRIDQVKVYNRGDGWFDDGLPMTLLFSTNGTDFKEVDKRTTSFGQWLPWTYGAHHQTARYIRIAGAPGKYVALSELVVSGKL
jgi:hypothetical protein